MNNSHEDITRLRAVYADRLEQQELFTQYSLMNPSYLFSIQNRQRHIINLLKIKDLTDLKSKRILEIGCGNGNVLLEFLLLGADIKRIFGIDLLMDRVRCAKNTLSNANIINTDGQRLPFVSQKFDIILQFTAFSSILNQKIKVNMASEMLRVLRNNGFILWYDFWWNPINPEMDGIKRREIRNLFPNCTYRFRKITLAPPITRKILNVSWGLANILESL